MNKYHELINIIEICMFVLNERTSTNCKNLFIRIRGSLIKQREINKNFSLNNEQNSADSVYSFKCHEIELATSCLIIAKQTGFRTRVNQNKTTSNFTTE